MNIKSKFDQQESENKEPKKKYMFLGYGGYNARGQGGPPGGEGGLIRSPHFFDSIFEMIGLKKKSRQRSEVEEAA
jgi:hypothetical protein